MLNRLLVSVAVIAALQIVLVVPGATADEQTWQRVGAKKAGVTFEVPDSWTITGISRKAIEVGKAEGRRAGASGDVIDWVVSAKKFFVLAPKAAGISAAAVLVTVYARGSPLVTKLSEAEEFASGGDGSIVVDSSVVAVLGKRGFRVSTREADPQAGGDVFFDSLLIFNRGRDLVSMRVEVDESRYDSSAQALADHILSSVTKL